MRIPKIPPPVVELPSAVFDASATANFLGMPIVRDRSIPIGDVIVSGGEIRLNPHFQMEMGPFVDAVRGMQMELQRLGVRWAQTGAITMRFPLVAGMSIAMEDTGIESEDTK